MTHLRENEGNPQSGEEKAPSFEAMTEEIRRSLRPGGPAVDWAAIHLYIAGDLDNKDREGVRERIVTWEGWNRAYWETMASLGETEQNAGGHKPLDE